MTNSKTSWDTSEIASVNHVVEFDEDCSTLDFGKSAMIENPSKDVFDLGMLLKIGFSGPYFRVKHDN